MFCKNCGNRLGDDDRVCAVCGESVEPKSAPRETHKDDRETPVIDDVKTPLFDFKWNVQDFPNEQKEQTTEDIDFSWGKPKDSSLVRKMQEAVDPEEIENTPTFSEEEETEKAVTDEWYEPFSMKKTPEDETLFMFNKRNEEFQELLDKELAKYSNSKRTTLPNDATKKYRIDDFNNELNRITEEKKAEAPKEEIIKPETSEEKFSKEELQKEETEKPERSVEGAPKEENPAETNSVAGMAILSTPFASPLHDSAHARKEGTPDDKPVESIPVLQVDEKKSEPAGDFIPAFINTSFASPFGKGASRPIQPEAASAVVGVTGSASIDDDEFLKDLPSGDDKSFTGPQPVSVQGKPEMVNTGVAKPEKVVGPEIVNEPVVFPFEMEEEDKPKDGVHLTEDNAKSSEPAPKVQKVMPDKPTDKTKADKGDDEKHGSKLIKFLIAMIIIILVLLAGIIVMKMAPNSGLGIMLNNFTESVFSGQSTAVVTDEPTTVAPSQDYEELIKSQQSENRNIKDIAYSSDIGYDDSASYSILGANNSRPIENNFWKDSKNGELLFDEQAVKTVIGFNSAWVDYLNNGSKDVFEYVVSGSGADSTLKDEVLPQKGDQVVYDKLSIGDIRQNGNKFYVWTEEDISIKSKEGKEKNSSIKQLYELETGSDKLSITTYVRL